ncbi:hypothetical protein LCGC14_2069280 [marine sediment metagenome]|uniref:Uncharacterized protein n=1 Tax=marine sediment metagenome TaxID=412755 RepID=A0A0F9F689_9ZZZZ
MEIDPITHKVDPDSIETKEVAEAFVVFLKTECQRHYDDIYATQDLIDKIKEKWDLWDMLLV